MKNYGLIGKGIAYSFSESYFEKKFEDENIMDAKYSTYDLSHLDQLKDLLKHNPSIKGLNVTIPYKESVITFLDALVGDAEKILAVNTIKIENSKLIGYNTDAYGFRTSLKPFFEPQHRKALILGTGGASKAIAYVLSSLGVDYFFVSRNPNSSREVSYGDLTVDAIKNFPFIINCSPVGTHPHILQKPDIPYEGIGNGHLLYDLVYNPLETAFMIEGRKRGASVVNGLSMLQHQADEAWRIWNKP